MTASTSRLEKPNADLRYWLANEDWYMSRYTREWLERTPQKEATDALAQIAEDAVAEPRAPWAVVATIVASAGLATSDGIGGKGPGARKAGTRAALILADMQDARALPPLIRVFSTGGFLQSKYQDQIETALTQFLAAAEAKNDPDIARYAGDIRALTERIWQSGERQDLSASLADLLITTIHYLQSLGGWENVRVLNLIRETALANAAKQPNRARVQNACAVPA
jgi:hypothetical protein